MFHAKGFPDFRRQQVGDHRKRTDRDGAVAGRTRLAGPAELKRAIQSAVDVFGHMPVFYRSNLFRALAAKLRANRSLVIETIVREAGKVIGETTTETDRGIFTTETAADEAKRIDGAVIPLNLPSSKGRFGIVRRFPTGPIAGISPCNFPLDLTLHKVASALAPGGPIVLKPPSLAPLTMLLIA